MSVLLKWAAPACAVVGLITLQVVASAFNDGYANPVSESEAIIVGKRLQNKDGEDLGQIVATVRNRRGTINYILLKTEEPKALDDDVIPVPWKLIAAGAAGNSFITSISSQKLQSAPRVDRRELETLSILEKQREVDAYFADEPVLRKKIKAPRNLRITPIQ